MSKNKFFIPLLVIAAATGFFGGIEYQKTKTPPLNNDLVNQTLGQPADLDFSLFWDVLARVKEKFVDRSKIDSKEIIYGAIDGMLTSLKDPYTQFLKPEEAKRFKEDIKGEFGGIGIEIGLRDGLITVIAPIEGTPAQKAGILAGDKILKIDQASSEGMGLDKAVSLIRGKKGTKVVLTINRNSSEKPREFALIRETIKIPIITSKLIEPNIGYIKLHTFNQNAGSEFEKTLKNLNSNGAEKFIIDFRNNPGGLLDLAIDIAGLFLEPNKVVVIEDFGGNKQNELKSETNGDYKNTPLVILINKGSASASEIVAGALHDQKGTILIGEKSFGKGSVQQVDELKNGASLKISIAKWLTPNGRSISDSGIEPDIKVELTPKDQEQNQDPQLDKAIEIILKL